MQSLKPAEKQYRVSEGDEIFVEKLGLEAEEKVSFDKVIAVSDDNGLKWNSLCGICYCGRLP